MTLRSTSTKEDAQTETLRETKTRHVIYTDDNQSALMAAGGCCAARMGHSLFPDPR